LAIYIDFVMALYAAQVNSLAMLFFLQRLNALQSIFFFFGKTIIYKALIPYIGISGQHLILTKNQNTTVIHPYTVHLKKSLPDE